MHERWGQERCLPQVSLNSGGVSLRLCLCGRRWWIKGVSEACLPSRRGSWRGPWVPAWAPRQEQVTLCGSCPSVLLSLPTLLSRCPAQGLLPGVIRARRTRRSSISSGGELRPLMEGPEVPVRLQGAPRMTTGFKILPPHLQKPTLLEERTSLLRPRAEAVGAWEEGTAQPEAQTWA